MAFVAEDRVKESTSTTGTGALSLEGSAGEFQSFGDVMADADTCTYTIVDESAGEFEVGEGTYDAGNDDLKRTTVRASSNAGAKVDLAAGAKTVFMAAVADRTPQLDSDPSSGDIPKHDGNNFQPTGRLAKGDTPTETAYEDEANTFTPQQQFDSGLDTRGDVVDDQGNTIYDYSRQQIQPETAAFKRGPVYDITHPDFGAVPDGTTTDDTSAIQSAIDAAKSSGGVVWFPAGHYYVPGGSTLKGTSSNPVEGVQLAGVGYKSRIDVPDTDNKGLTMEWATDCVVRDLRFTGNPPAGSFQTAIRGTSEVNDCVFARLHIEDWGYDGINLLTDCEGNKILFNHVDNMGDDGINPGGNSSNTNHFTRRTLVLGNTVQNNGSDGLHLSQESENVTAIGNHVINCNNGASFYRSSKSILAYNHFIDCNRNGITAEKGDTTNNFKNKVVGNVVINPSSNGIKMDAGEDHKIKGNLIVDAGAWGIFTGGSLEGAISILENRVFNATEDGISTASPGGQSDHRINDNLVVDAGDLAIDCHTDGCEIKRNRLRGTNAQINLDGADIDAFGNRVKGSATPLLNEDSGSSKANVRDNRLVCTQTSSGIVVSLLNNNGGTFADNYVEGGDEGIRSGSDWSIRGNTFTGAASYGIVASTGGSGGELVDNEVLGSYTNEGIFVANSGMLIKDNRVPDDQLGTSNFPGNSIVIGNICNSFTSGWGPNATVYGNQPSLNVFRGETDGDSDNTISVTFDKATSNRPIVRFGRRGGGINDVTFTTDANGDYNGADIDIATAGGTIDVFVEER